VESLCASLFRSHGISYALAAKPESDLYRDLLPLLNSGKVELLDHARLVSQLCELERRVTRAGKDSVDHGPGGHDDIANAVGGALTLALDRRPLVISPVVLARVRAEVPYRIQRERELMRRLMFR
jgi:hypothetical protein